jgi:hypothetical protein
LKIKEERNATPGPSGAGKIEEDEGGGGFDVKDMGAEADGC